MTTNFDFDRITGEWLADGPMSLSDRALQAALDEVHVTHQRRFGPAWRTFALNSTLARLAAAIAVIAVVLVGGLFVLGRLPGGTVGASPSPSPTPAGTPIALVPNLDEYLTPGEYSTTRAFRVPGITLTLGERWSVNEVKPGRVWLATATSDEKALAAQLFLEVPSAVYKDPCGQPTVRLQPSTGPTIEDFIADLRRIPHFTVGPTSTTSIDGVTATEFDLTNDIPPGGAGCVLLDGLAIYPWDTGQIDPGMRQHLVLLELNGTRLLLDAMYVHPEPTTEQQIADVIDSVRLP